MKKSQPKSKKMKADASCSMDGSCAGGKCCPCCPCPSSCAKCGCCVTRRALRFVMMLVVAIIIAILVIAAVKPARLEISRSVTIGASAESVYQHIASPRMFNKWSPWGDVDAAAKVTFKGPASGNRAQMIWNGSKIGEGKMTVVKTNAPNLVEYKVEMVRPLQSVATATFKINEVNGQTLVTWSTEKDESYMHRVISTAMFCEMRMKKAFTTGLNNLKTIAEKKAAQ